MILQKVTKGDVFGGDFLPFFASLLAGYGQFFYFYCRTGEGTPEVKVIPDHFDIIQDFTEIPGDGNF